MQDQRQTQGENRKLKTQNHAHILCDKSMQNAWAIQCKEQLISSLNILEETIGKGFSDFQVRKKKFPKDPKIFPKEQSIKEKTDHL